MGLIIILCVVVLTLKWIKPQCVTIQIKATEQYFHAVLFVMLYKVVLTFESVNKTLVCDHPKKVTGTRCFPRPRETIQITPDLVLTMKVFLWMCLSNNM